MVCPLVCVQNNFNVKKNSVNFLPFHNLRDCWWAIFWNLKPLSFPYKFISISFKELSTNMLILLGLKSLHGSEVETISHKVTPYENTSVFVLNIPSANSGGILGYHGSLIPTYHFTAPMAFFSAEEEFPEDTLASPKSDTAAVPSFFNYTIRYFRFLYQNISRY